MNSSTENGFGVAPKNIAQDEMDWDAYAEHYDLMCEFNPSYQANVSQLLSVLHNSPIPEGATVCDLGAGTGNYTVAMAQAFPRANYVHVDFDERMNELALRKYRSYRINSVRIVSDYAQTVDFPPNTFDLVVCVNALYAISPQVPLLHKIRSWLKPSGIFFVIDFGRRQRSLDWALYLLRESIKSRRTAGYLRAVIEGREVFKQNRRSSKGQASGRYWLHSTADFGEILNDTGFIVDRLESCYRDYADLAVCRTPADSTSPETNLDGAT
jgi:ubiquinone/menaquinone biosynthesis C-methylase UbiE